MKIQKKNKKKGMTSKREKEEGSEKGRRLKGDA